MKNEPNIEEFCRTLPFKFSDMELLRTFAEHGYPNDIGPGVYDIHSPRVPSVDEVSDLIEIALGSIPDRQVWVNPDCGLKTRTPEEAVEKLRVVVEATNLVREELGSCSPHITRIPSRARA